MNETTSVCLMSIHKGHSAATSWEREASYWRQQEMLLLNAVIRLVGKSLSPEIVIREMLHLMSELLGLNRGRVVLRNQDDPLHQACIRYSYGLTKAQIERGVYLPGEGITGQVLQTGQPIIVQDIDQEPLLLFRSVRRKDLPPETVSFIALPLTVLGQVEGVFACHRIRGRQRHLNDDMSVLNSLATLTAQVLGLDRMVREKTQALEVSNALLSQALESDLGRLGIVGRSTTLLRAMGEIERVASSTASVLLLGESGTGKELFARALHLLSPRSDGPFVRVNCAAIPESLFESELFGHEKGAFTGAHASRTGLFEQAQGGTIFLDEIGELPLPLQAKLLRTLQESTVMRLGGKREIALNVRVVSATNQNLPSQIAAGRFREDLYYRLNVIPIGLPSLRDRREDMHLLILHFLNRSNQAHQRNIYLTPEVIAALESHTWPGNVRELSNVIERLVLLSRDSKLELAEMRSIWSEAQTAVPLDMGAPERNNMPRVRHYESAHLISADVLVRALREHRTQSRAAQSLGMTLRQFNYRLKKLGISPS
jgi:Nif-specific regulatory protein